jgi:hypothetical protein
MISMGAFGNYPYNPKPVIDFTKLKTVPVIVNFAPDGRFIPICFSYQNPDGSVEKYNVTVKSFIEVDNRFIFYCYYINREKQHEVNLAFYVNECRWVIV